MLTYSSLRRISNSGLPKRVSQQPSESEQAFDWARQVVEILRPLTDILSNTLDAWARFSSPDGDIGYFVESDSSALPSNTIRSLHIIKQVFWKLEGVHKAFLALRKRCFEYMSAVSKIRSECLWDSQ